MKVLLYLSLLLCFTSCLNNPAKEHSMNQGNRIMNGIDTLEVSKKELFLNQNEGIWYYKNTPYSGYSLKFFSNGALEEKIGYYRGKKDGVTQRWSPNGVLRFESHYHQNQLVGFYRAWWENGVLSEESMYVDGEQEGVEKQWYASGQLSKLRHLVNGKEQGMQQAWLENGTLYVNYESKNDRIFGLKRANLCYKLENEKVIRN